MHDEDASEASSAWMCHPRLLERSRTLEFFGLNMLQDRRPEYYGLLSDKAAYYKAVAQPLVTQTYAAADEAAAIR